MFKITFNKEQGYQIGKCHLSYTLVPTDGNTNYNYLAISFQDKVEKTHSIIEFFEPRKAMPSTILWKF